MKRLRLLLVVSGLLLGLTACGGGDSSPAVLKPLGSASTSATASAAPPSAAPPTSSSAAALSQVASADDVVPRELPTEARALTSEGAQAFATYWITSLSAALVSGDVRLLQKLSDPGCGGCQDNINSIEGVAARHEKVDGGGEVRVRFAVAPAVENAETIVLLNLDADQYVRRAADGSVVRRGAGFNNAPFEMRCIWRNGRWVAAGFRPATP